MAGYNSYFPQTYSTPYTNGNLNYNSNIANAAAVQNSAPSGGINWVQGEAGARSASIYPNQPTLLMDSERNVFYIKTLDPAGMPLPLRTFKYEEVTNSKELIDNTQDFVTREEFEKAIEKLKTNKEEKKEVKKDEPFII